MTHHLPQAGRARCLVLVGARDRVHPPQLLAPDPERGFDIAIWGCADELGDRRVPRWPALGRLLQEHVALWQDHDLVWLPDDDVQARGPAVEAMCALMQAHDLWLAQPALDWDSPITQVAALHNPAFTLRSTNWIDDAMPCFRSAFLHAVLPTAEWGVGTPGLGHLWASLAPRGRCAVLDAVPLHRPSAAPAGEPALARDLLQVMSQRGIADLRTFSWGGVDLQGRLLALDDEHTRDDFLGRLLRGYAAGITDPAALGALLKVHLDAAGLADEAPAASAGPGLVPAAPAPTLRRSPILA